MHNYIRNKKFRVGKSEHFLRVGQITGNRGAFFRPKYLFEKSSDPTNSSQHMAT